AAKRQLLARRISAFTNHLVPGRASPDANPYESTCPTSGTASSAKRDSPSQEVASRFVWKFGSGSSGPPCRYPVETDNNSWTRVILANERSFADRSGLVEIHVT